MRVFGSDLFVKDNILEANPKTPFKYVINAVNMDMAKLGPAKRIGKKARIGDLELTSPHWGG